MKLKEELMNLTLADLSKIDFKEQFLENYQSCCLCGTELYFTHVTNFVQFDVQEESWCPSCNIRQQKNAHTLQ